MREEKSQKEEVEVFELGLEDDYEDDDFTIYFNKDTLLAHINYLQDDNLFKIHVVQEEEQNLDKMKKQGE